MEKNQKLVSRYKVDFRRDESCAILEDARDEQFLNSPAVARFCKRMYDFENASIGYCEHCYALLFNRRNYLNGYVKVSEGGLDSTIIDRRKVVKAALDANADGVILVHNHPGGDPHPGQSDLKQTEALKKALGLFDIRLLDHIILAEGSYFSFADDGTARI